MVEAEKKLQDAKNEIERARLRASGGPETGVLQVDIQKDIDNINTVRQERLAALNDLEISEQEFAARRQAINLESDIQILEQRLNLYKEGTEERLKLENELAQKRKELADVSVESNLAAEISDIEAARDARIVALKDVEASEKELAAQRRVIETQATIDILKERLNLEDLSKNERLNLLVELYDAELELEKAKNDKIREERRVLNEDTAEAFSFSTESLSDAIGVIGDLQDATFERRVQQIEDKYAREIELAEGNTEAINKLEEERDAKLRRLQEEQFKRQRRLQISQAIIGGAQAIVSTLAAPPGPADILSLGAIRAIQIGLITATTAAQIATIASQSFAQGGYTGPGAGAPDKTGRRPVGIVHEHEYVVPTQVLTSPKGAKLVSELEAMRKKLPSKSPYVEYVSARDGLYATGGFAASDIQPNLPTAAVSNVTQVNARTELSDNQLTILAESIGRSVYRAIFDGTLAANEEVATINERQANLENKIG